MASEHYKVGFAYNKRIGEVRYATIDNEIWFGLNFVSHVLGLPPSIAWRALHNSEAIETFFGSGRRPTVSWRIRTGTLDGDIDTPVVSLNGVRFLCAISKRIDSYEIYRALANDLAPQILVASKAESTGKQFYAKHDSKAAHTTDDSGRMKASEDRPTGSPPRKAKFSPEALRRLLEDIYAEDEQEEEKNQS